MTKAHMDAIHAFCRENKELVTRSKMCGCFYCCKTFKASVKYVIKGKLDDTAICPLCGIDSVLPDSVSAINKPLLKAMSDRYFGTDNCISSEEVDRRSEVRRAAMAKLTGEEKKMLFPSRFDNERTKW